MIGDLSKFGIHGEVAFMTYQLYKLRPHIGSSPTPAFGAQMGSSHVEHSVQAFEGMLRAHKLNL